MPEKKKKEHEPEQPKAQASETAPEQKEDGKQVFQSIYDEMVCPCVKAIQEGKFQEACDLYERITRELEAKYRR